jgi:mono/diheme cytochrome c family protein
MHKCFFLITIILVAISLTFLNAYSQDSTGTIQAYPTNPNSSDTLGTYPSQTPSQTPSQSDTTDTLGTYPSQPDTSDTLGTFPGSQDTSSMAPSPDPAQMIGARLAQPDQVKSDTTKQQASTDKGVGPVTSVKLGPLDQKMAEQGKALFNSNCSTCHSLNERKIGPALGNITSIRTPEYVMNMILNTTEMQQKDPQAKELVSEYHMRMPPQSLDRQQARSILEYLRSVNQDSTQSK